MIPMTLSRKGQNNLKEAILLPEQQQASFNSLSFDASLPHHRNFPETCVPFLVAHFGYV